MFQIPVLFVVAINYALVSSSTVVSSYDSLWKAYQVRFIKLYDAAEESVRRQIWQANVAKITKHNLEADFGLHSYRLQLNKFSDMTSAELDVYRKCASARNSVISETQSPKSQCDENCVAALPDRVDWRTKGYVTPVKDQGACGSCWAFSATGALEGQSAMAGKHVNLSEQNLVDCSRKQGNKGCDGGWMDYAFQYVIDNEGIDTEATYKYRGKNGKCKFVRSGVGANCTRYVSVKSRSEKDLQHAVATEGPVSIAIDAGGDKFMDYSDGIYFDTTCSTKYLNHAVLVVGYGTQNGSDYWIVKNSWGEEWGMKGYILMSRNKHNQCGIATHAVYPKL